ncbi:Xaa-Pro aminopeptidase [Haloferax mucosum ATCC BAA-1512]|uniref:Xaa-Pro aminopeptidase n=1 Tax=Haloferax mucosum ATCC BAA-1512 TaxID=662479 RepID=M0IG86_9EURY|nr:M24 family metallopeptidase [Haloferax mucosum]ELZ94863.1 Xaa-Pro aminopeptidase [Haloferax mucosum ATCC BAA-1512]
MPSGPRGGAAIDAAIDERDAVGFVAVCRGDGPTGRYLTGRRLDTDFVFVRAAGETHLRVPSTVDIPVVADAASVRTDDRPAGKAAAAVLAASASESEGTVLASRTIPHDAALHLESAGYDLASTAAVRDARAVKDETERETIESTQRAAKRAVARAAEILARSNVADEADGMGPDGVLVWDGAPLSAERLRRQVNARLAVEGVDAAGETTVRAGSRSESAERGGGVERDRSERDEGGGPKDDSAVELIAGEPIVVSVAPRGPGGYRGALARTFVVESGGGWERRAHVACDAARDVTLVEADPGASAGFLGSEIRAETGAFGFSMDGEVTRDVGGGIGLSAREAPTLDGDTELAAGNVLRVRAAVTHAEHGRVELTDVLVVGADGPQMVVDAPTGLDPRQW